MKKNFNIPILFFLILLISKEVFSYDSEKVVILCILSFITIAYFNFKDMIYQILQAKSLKLKDEYQELIFEKEKLEKEIRKFWRIFLDIEDQMVEIFCWLKSNISLFINKMNKNRKLITFFLIKDQLNLLIKNQLKINQSLHLLVIKKSINNVRLNFLNNVSSNLIYKNNLNYFYNKLIEISKQSNIIYLILNKLNTNKEFNNKSNIWINNNVYLYLLLNK